jgi:hypothetical protein
MSEAGNKAAARLRRHFDKVQASTRIGGAQVLKELGDLASACVMDESPQQDSVAFVLSQLFTLHAEDRTERQVTGSDAYLLSASGLESLQEAITFIHNGGSPDEAVHLVAALARLTPDRLYGRWPPSEAV